MLPILKKLFEARDNAPEATRLLVGLLGVRVTETTLTRELEEHPDYPGLLSISDVLNQHGIETLALKLAPEKLDQTPTPFITLAKGEKSGATFFTVVREIRDGRFSFFDQEKQAWVAGGGDRLTGPVLLAEAGEQAGEKDYALHLREERRKRFLQRLIAGCIPALVLVAGGVALFREGAGALLPFVFSLLTLAGALIGVLLLWYEVDQHNPALKQICAAGKKVNCGAVLQSKASKVAGVSWSAIGFIYFAGELLLFLFTGGITNPLTLALLGWLNVVALPYVVFSIYYQWRVARQWCVLCLGVQAILVLQGITAFLGGWYGFLSPSPGLAVTAVAAFALPGVAIFLLVPALQRAKESRDHLNKLQRLKHNPQIFDALLDRQKVLTEPTGGLGIILGNPQARHKIIKVCNPYCGPCARAHVPMEELLDNNPDVQLQIIFTATNVEGDVRMPPVRHLLAIAGDGDEKRTKQALDDWYLAETKDYDAFASKHPVNGALSGKEAQIEAMRQWCDQTGIVFTPTFFVNGRQLPEIYTVSDLKYFLTV